MEDFLAALSEPEWPVAELILHVFSNLMVKQVLSFQELHRS